MPEDGIRSTYSQCPCQILTYDRIGLVGAGSGFFFALSGDWFLITNWHVVTGRNPFSPRTALRPDERVPEYLKVKLAAYADGVSGAFSTVARRVDIYEKDLSRPRWFEHPHLGATCDVIALRLARPDNCPRFMHNAANLISADKVPVEPGTVVFVVGFPAAISVGIGLPLWKSGYIASEPHYDVTVGGELAELGGLQNGYKLPAFFIDSLTREGMSGSPVFASYTGTWSLSDPYEPLNFDDPATLGRSDIAIGGTGREFVGCYSGRVGAQEGQAALGLCWRRDAIEQICRAQNTGRHPDASK